MKTKFKGDLGLQFTIHIANHYSVPELVKLAALSEAKGFDQVWVNDNLTYRNLFVVLAAMASSVPIRLGTAIMVPYFRNPVDLADTIAAITELTDGREFSVGIARGASMIAGKQVEAEKPLTIIRETVSSVNTLLAGDSTYFRDYPHLAKYFHLNPEREFKLNFSPGAPVRFYSGGGGPKNLKIAGEIMDGILIGGYYIPLAKSGRLEGILEPSRAVASESQPAKSMYDTCELNVSISHDRERALEFAKPYVSHILPTLRDMGFSDEELFVAGVEPSLVDTLEEAFSNGATVPEASKLVPDEAVKSCFVAGSPEECQHQIKQLMDTAQTLDFDQVCFAKLGPDYAEAISLLRDEILTK